MEVFFSRQLGPRGIQIGSWPESAQAGARPNLRFFFDVTRATGLPHVKRRPPYDFRSLCTPRSRKQVARLCEKEIETLGYSFD